MDPELQLIMSRGDVLADAVIGDVQHMSPTVRAMLHEGLRNGSATVPNAPESMLALLRSAEAACAAVDRDAIVRAAEIYCVVNPLWMSLSQMPGVLAHVYAHPRIASTLVQSGRLLEDRASRRLQETLLWNLQLLKPEGIAVGSPAYVHTLQVRLLHATVRHRMCSQGYDVAVHGIPIDQRETVRTLLGFFVVGVRSLQSLGFTFDESQLLDIASLWQQVGVLVGVEGALLDHMKTFAQAAELLELIDCDAADPGEESQLLVRASLIAQSTRLSHVMRLPDDVMLMLEQSLVRMFHGGTLADKLGVEQNWTSALLPMLTDANRFRWQHACSDNSRWQTSVSQSQQAIRDFEASLVGPAEYQHT